ncbi:MAG: HAMP domain-containing sensor histidine kinase [Firmicutes bacterium]|nr:HAMP domain-containing sensor histidine kinase [Bacillota bacterium]
MAVKLSGIRWHTVRAYALAAALTALIVVALLQLLWPEMNRLQPVNQPLAIGIVVLIVAVVVNTVVAFRQSKRFKRRLDALTAFAAVLAHGNLAQRLDIDDSDELGRVVYEINGLAQTMESQVASLQRLATSNKDLAGKAHSAAIIEERQRLARDLHDAVSQRLFALTMLADAASETLQQGQVPTEAQIYDIAELAAGVQQEMRSLLLHLRPVQLDEESLTKGIESLVEELAQRTGLTFELHLQSLPVVTSGVENHLFRILQEALANILRHAAATHVQLQLYSREGELFLQISDNGRGFDLRQQKRAAYGLQTMQERCDEIGGRLNITSREAVGTRVDVRVPLQEEVASNE